MVNSLEIFDSLIDSVAVIDNKGKIIYTNTAWRQFSSENSGGFERNDIGVNYLDICSSVIGEDSQGSSEALLGIKEVINRNRPLFEMEYPCHSISEFRWFILRCTPLKGNVNLSIVSHINVSKRRISEETIKKQNNQLININKRLEITMFRIAHDIQTPLNSVIGLIQLSRIDNESIDKYFSLIEQSAFNLKSFIKETLEISKSTNKYKLIDFNKLLSDLYESIQYAGLEQIKFKTEVNQTGKFYTYENEIASVISNLIDNSIKYYDNKKENSFILVSIDSNWLETKISIKDNGIGMSKETIFNMFDFSFQANNESSDGFGVGLSIVKQSIVRINGVIDVNSKLGEGTEFNIVIPNLKKLEV